MKRFLSIIFAVLMLIACTVTLSACKQEPDEVHDYTFSTYFIENGRAYKGKRCECGKYQKEQEIVSAIIATTQNLNDLIQSAGENSTIVLSSGNYKPLFLIGKNAFPQGLTIIGTDNTIIRGVSISSGIKYEHVTSDDKTTLNQNLVDDATLNGNLTFRNVSFSGAVSIKNASIDGFSLYDCTFINETGLFIRSNIFCDKYGNDTVSGQKINKYREAWCSLYAKNIVIDNCSFKNVYYYTSEDSAIMLHSVENATIRNCVVNGSKYNALQINAHDYCKTKGTILIESNTFKSTPSRLIRFSNIESGSTVTLKDNILENTGNYNDPKEGILKASSVDGVNFEFIGNTYGGEPIHRYSYGIIIEQEME